MILHHRFLDFLFARCQNGHFSDTVKRPFFAEVKLLHFPRICVEMLNFWSCEVEIKNILASLHICFQRLLELRIQVSEWASPLLDRRLFTALYFH